MGRYPSRPFGHRRGSLVLPDGDRNDPGLDLPHQRWYAVFIHSAATVLLAASVTAGEQREREATRPATYILDYASADQCCPPIRSTFLEANRTFSVVRGRRVRHKPNGGYGLPVVDKVDGKNLLHVGADLGWHQVGEPVFAIANGVVRVSTGPKFDAPREERHARTMTWGNFIAIEHRFGPDQYITSLYGHLGTDRHVRAGDVVRTGQQIGTIGRGHARINGGYTPHLHFGVREGRSAETGAVLLRLNIEGRSAEMKLAALGEESIEVRLPDGLAPRIDLTVNGQPYVIERQDGKTTAPAAILWEIQRPGFALVGYALSTDGWKDPIRFLREHRADVNPAPFQLQSQRRSL